MATNNVIPAGTTQGRAHGRDMVPPLLLAALSAGVVSLWYLGVEYKTVISTSLVWGLALYVSGALIGFLFGIPKVPERDAGAPVSASSTAVATSAGGADNGGATQDVQKVEKSSPKRPSGINSNLVEVSDWLTKIIVGVGLVELKRLPEYGESLASFMARSLTSPTSSLRLADATLTSVAGAVALYFGVLGFITGYLMTRIFLAVIMNDADRDAEEASGWRLPAGEVINTRTMLGGLMSAVTDLQGKVVKILSGTKDAPDLAAAATPAPAPVDVGSSVGNPLAASTETSVDSTLAAPDTSPDAVTLPKALTPSLDKSPAGAGSHTVLWVDDRPNQNALIVDRLRAYGAQVQQVTSTVDAVDWLSRKDYDLVITDMHRGEKAGDGRPSGLRLLDILRSMFEDPAQTRNKPMVVLYCSRSSLDKYGRHALETGADLATSSEVELLSALSQWFPRLT